MEKVENDLIHYQHNVEHENYDMCTIIARLEIATLTPWDGLVPLVCQWST